MCRRLAKRRNFVSCNLQDSSILSWNLQDRNLSLYNLQKTNFLLFNLEGRCLLPCNLQDSGFLSCRLRDSSFLSCNLHDRNFLRGNLMHKDVAEARLDFRRFYLWWFRNLACGDLTGNNGIQNEPVDLPPGLVWGEGMVWLSVCGLQWSSNIIRESERRPSFDIF